MSDYVLYACYVLFVIAAGATVLKAVMQADSVRRHIEWEILFGYAVLSGMLWTAYEVFPGFGKVLDVVVFILISAFLIFGYIVDRQDRHAARDNLTVAG